MVKEVKELRRLSTEELREKLDQLLAELRTVRTEIAMGGAVAKPARARNIRRTIARVKTILRERELGINV
ncbi:MAG: 50S ribosomal protein L29 [Aigarchaeota archaeon]|nr:50S ribosomal protein L29 [Candidatus Pelearchaeum maunauluense]